MSNFNCKEIQKLGMGVIYSFFIKKNCLAVNKQFGTEERLQKQNLKLETMAVIGAHPHLGPFYFTLVQTQP